MNKKLSFMIAGMFALVLLLGMGSSYSFTQNGVQVEVTQDFPNPVTPGSSYEIKINVTNNNGASLNLTWSDSTTSASSIPSNSTLLDSSEKEFVLKYAIPSSFSGSFNHTANLKVYNGSNVIASFNPYSTANYIPYSLYSGSNDGQLDIADIESNTVAGWGEDDDFWYPLDEVEVTFEVQNEGNHDIENIEIEVCLYDSEDQKCILDERDMDLSEDDFDLDEDDELEITLNFIVEPEELNVDNEKYQLHISAVGKIDDRNSANDGKVTGISEYKEFDIIIEDFAIVDDVRFSSSQLSCGEELTVSGDLWNVGDSDFDDDEVYLYVEFVGLGYSEVIEFSKGIDSLEKEEFQLRMNIPEEIEEKMYRVSFEVYNDEDLDNNDLYENSERDEAVYSAFFQVRGSCVTIKPTLDAEIVSEEVRAGKDFVFRSTFTNPGNERITLNLFSEGHEEWSTLGRINPSVLILEAGESKEATFTYNLNKDVEGEKIFVVKAVNSEGKVVLENPISTGEIQSANLLSKLPNVSSRVLGMVLLNAILVLVIIIVLVRTAKRR